MRQGIFYFLRKSSLYLTIFNIYSYRLLAHTQTATHTNTIEFLPFGLTKLNTAQCTLIIMFEEINSEKWFMCSAWQKRPQHNQYRIQHCKAEEKSRLVFVQISTCLVDVPLFLIDSMCVCVCVLQRWHAKSHSTKSFGLATKMPAKMTIPIQFFGEIARKC